MAVGSGEITQARYRGVMREDRAQWGEKEEEDIKNDQPSEGELALHW